MTQPYISAAKKSNTSNNNISSSSSNKTSAAKPASKSYNCQTNQGGGRTYKSQKIYEIFKNVLG